MGSNAPNEPVPVEMDEPHAAPAPEPAPPVEMEQWEPVGPPVAFEDVEDDSDLEEDGADSAEEKEAGRDDDMELAGDAPVLCELWRASYVGDLGAIRRAMDQVREHGLSLATRDKRPYCIAETTYPVGLYYTALHNAVIGRQLEAVKLIAPHLSKRGLDTEDEMRMSALDHALDMGELRIAKALHQCGASLSCCDHPFMSAVQLAVNGHDVPTLMWVLGFPEMQRLENINARAAESGLTPLHVACQRNNPTFVKLLLAAGADANKAASTESWLTPIHIAFAREELNLEVLNALLCANAGVYDTDRLRQNVLHHLAFNSGDPLGVHWLCKNELLSSRLLEHSDKARRAGYWQGYTPLQLACETGKWNLTATLLTYGADLAKLDVMASSFCPTPECFAVINGYCTDIVTDLEEHMPFDVAAIVTEYLRPAWSGHIVPRAKRRRIRDLFVAGSHA